MCNINQNAQMQLLAMGISVIGKLIESELSVNNPVQSTDVLSTATQAYQQGKITKSQLMGVINALDETTTVQTTARTVRTGDLWNQEYISAHNYLNQYRR